MANLPKDSDAKLKGLIADSDLCNGSQLPKEKFFCFQIFYAETETANLPKDSDAKLKGLIADSDLCNGSQLPKRRYSQ
jgi:hypothetical protein